MAVMTDKLHSGLQKVFLHGIGGEVVYGVRYVLADTQDVKRKTGILDELRALYAEAVNGGFPDGAICSAVSVREGAVFVLSVPAAKQLMLETAQASGIPGWDTQVQDGWMALDVSLADAKGRLAEHVIQQVRAGIPSFDVALFGSTPNKITQFVAVLPDKRRVLLTYPNFNVTHTDIANINSVYLIPRGYRISRVVFREFIPGKCGIITTFKCEHLGTAPTAW
ncbi:hypothetical protein FACS1894208_00900 [Clostridia bacterium]|nr:hypothetical protein FACS1894208_00900 [Clostridia bacterium]